MTTVVPKLTLRQTLILTCVLFTVLTVVSSGIALALGAGTETHIHLLQRLAYTVVGVGSVHLYGTLRGWFGGAPLATGLTYGVAMAVVLALTWALGRFVELHPQAYRDIFLNFTVIYALVVTGVIAVHHVLNRRRDRPPLAGHGRKVT